MTSNAHAAALSAFKALSKSPDQPGDARSGLVAPQASRTPRGRPKPQGKSATTTPSSSPWSPQSRSDTASIASKRVTQSLNHPNDPQTKPLVYPQISSPVPKTGHQMPIKPQPVPIKPQSQVRSPQLSTSAPVKHTLHQAATSPQLRAQPPINPYVNRASTNPTLKSPSISARSPASSTDSLVGNSTSLALAAATASVEHEKQQQHQYQTRPASYLGQPLSKPTFPRSASAHTGLTVDTSPLESPASPQATPTTTQSMMTPKFTRSESTHSLIRSPSPISSQDMIKNVKQSISNHLQPQPDTSSKRLSQNLDPKEMIKSLKTTLQTQSQKRAPEPSTNNQGLQRLADFRSSVDAKRVSTPVAKPDTNDLWAQHAKNVGLFESLGNLSDPQLAHQERVFSSSSTTDEGSSILSCQSGPDNAPQIVVSEHGSTPSSTRSSVVRATSRTLPISPRLGPIGRLDSSTESLTTQPVSVPSAAATDRVAAAAPHTLPVLAPAMSTLSENPSVSSSPRSSLDYGLTSMSDHISLPLSHPPPKRKPPPQESAVASGASTHGAFSDGESVQPTSPVPTPFPRFPDVSRKKKHEKAQAPEPLSLSDIGDADDSEDDTESSPSMTAPPFNQQPVAFKKTMRKTNKRKEKKLSFNEDKPWKNHTELNYLSDQERKRYEGVWVSNRGSYVGCMVTRLRGVDYEGNRPVISGETEADPSLVAALGASSEVDEVRDIHGLDHVDIDQLMVAAVVKRIWKRSRLPDQTLEQIWSKVDFRHDGTLTKSEFLVGMWLIDQCLYGRKLPKKVDDRVWESLGYYGFNMNVNLKKKRL
ncbi:hypothetical protein DIURU_003875 [Diutina rugosa]|uniref:Uncharacterized protein n=1 Tax=Diutina rugosa TaxID=5481 RepID=A0A642UJQ0_DIURU|nr:uncharacterized protein DIURU_003875 [Diutina rugosa]KAA8900294.1 hypothetical protein DIURU_003875 [Diutina rugosa]